jgi:hypothetical protein
MALAYQKNNFNPRDEITVSWQNHEAEIRVTIKNIDSLNGKAFRLHLVPSLENGLVRAPPAPFKKVAFCFANFFAWKNDHHSLQ